MKSLPLAAFNTLCILGSSLNYLQNICLLITNKLDNPEHEGSLRESQISSGSIFQRALVQETIQVLLREADYHQHLCMRLPIALSIVFDSGSPLICLSCQGGGVANLPQTTPAVYSIADLGLSPGKNYQGRGKDDHKQLPKDKIENVNGSISCLFCSLWQSKQIPLRETKKAKKISLWETQHLVSFIQRWAFVQHVSCFLQQRTFPDVVQLKKVVCWCSLWQTQVHWWALA